MKEYENLIENLKKFIKVTPLVYFRQQQRGDDNVITVKNMLTLSKGYHVHMDKEGKPAIHEEYKGIFQLNSQSLAIAIEEKDAKDLINAIIEKNANYTEDSYKSEQNSCLLQELNEANKFLNKGN